MKNNLQTLLTGAMLIGVAGCGLKGPLYAPPADPPVTKTTQPDTNGGNIAPGRSSNQSQ